MTQIQTFGMNVPVRTNAQGTSKNQTEEEALTAAMFAGIMQDAASTSENFFANTEKKTDAKDEVLGLVGNNDKKSDTKTSYEAMSSEKTKRVEKTSTTSADDAKKSNQTTAVKETAAKVADEIKEKYGVTDEQLENAMETLGLSMVDLLDTSKLASLVANLTGEEKVTALVADPTFTDLLGTVNELVSTLQTEQNIAPTDFKQVLSDINTELIDQFKQDNVDILSGEKTGGALVDDAVTNIASTGANTEVIDTNASEVTVENESVLVSSQSTITSDTKADVSDDKTTTDGSVALADDSQIRGDRVVTKETTDEEPDRDNGQGNSPERSDQVNKASDDSIEVKASNDPSDDFKKIVNNVEHHDNSALANGQQAVNQPQTMVDFDSQVVMPQTSYTYEDIQNLMEQVNGAARAIATSDSHTIQMQLNPENLGRLFMSVTEKQGVVTAQLTVTSEDTRAALQSQLVELRNNLENQGVKVEAVEVTVASHEFEQNLENQDTTNREMMEREAREQNGTAIGGRRSISMEDLDELGGVMSEEERIVASMMQMNGQSVDYLA